MNNILCAIATPPLGRGGASRLQKHKIRIEFYTSAGAFTGLARRRKQSRALPSSSDLIRRSMVRQAHHEGLILSLSKDKDPHQVRA
jgi:hypothetical protein